MIAALACSWQAAGLRAAVPITKPRDYEDAEERGPRLPVEGSMVVNLRCHIEHDRKSGWRLVVFEKGPGLSQPVSRWALPCRLLERMEEITRSRPKAIFRISGENTVYERRGFILLQKAVLELEPPPAEPRTRAASHGARPATSQPADPTTAPTTTTTGPGATTGPLAATAPATIPAATTSWAAPSVGADAPAGGATSDDIRRAMQRDRLGQPILAGVRPRTSRVNESSVAPLSKGKVLAPGRAWAVVDRLVTIMPAGADRWVRVRFESDNTLREPPMRLLPCGMLRKAEGMGKATGRGKTARLRISGVITFYKGGRFLLLRKVLVERDLGRF